MLLSTWWVIPIAALLGFAGTGLVRRISLLTGFVARPNPLIPQHKRDVALMGGIGVALGAAGSQLAWLIQGGNQDAAATAILLPAAAFLVLGLIDDLRPFTAKGKLTGQVAIALFAAWYGIRADLVGILIVDILASSLWIVFLVNAVNLTDVCDGLVGGLALIGLGAVAIIEPEIAIPALVTAGACAGFLMWNAPPARVFLGDAGSHLLGFLLASCGLHAIQNDAFANLPVAILIAGVPVFELCLLVVIRVQKGIPWWQGSPDHFSLRLQAAGLSPWATDLYAWSAAALMAVLAVCWKKLDAITGLIALSITVTILVIGGVRLTRWEVPPKENN